MTVTVTGKSHVGVLFSLLPAAVQIQVIKGSVGSISNGSESGLQCTLLLDVSLAGRIPIKFPL